MAIRVTQTRILCTIGGLFLLLVSALLVFRMEQSVLACERGQGGDVCILTRSETFKTVIAGIAIADIRAVEVEKYGSRPSTSTFVLVTGQGRTVFSSRYCTPPSGEFADEVRAFLRDAAQRDLTVEYDCRPEVLPHIGVFLVAGLVMVGGGLLTKELSTPRPGRRIRER